MRYALDTGDEYILGLGGKSRSLRDRLRHSLMSKVDSDDKLVERAGKGDRDAYRQLVERYQARAFAIAFDIVKSREDAEDVVQESFVKAYLSLGQFRGQSSFYTWLYRIVYNMAIDYKRKLSRRGGDALSYSEAPGEEIGASGPLSDPSQDPQAQLVRKEQAKRIQEVLGSISEEHRTVLMLREIDGLNYDEISKVVGINKGTVMSRLHYARKKLQKALADLVPGGEARSDDSSDDRESRRLSLKGM